MAKADWKELALNAMDMVFRAAHHTRKQLALQSRAATGAEVAVLAYEQGLLRAGFCWSPDESPTVRAASPNAPKAEQQGETR